MPFGSNSSPKKSGISATPRGDPAVFGRFACAQKPSGLFVFYRVLVFVYFLSWLIYDGIYYEEEGKEDYYFIYFTNWNFVLLSLRNFLALVVAIHALHGGEYASFQAESNIPWIYRLFWGLNTMVSIASILLTAVFWSLIYDPSRSNVTARNLHVHGANALFAIVDIAITATPWRLGHIWVGMVYGVAYGVFTGLYFAANGKNESGNQYIYKIIDYGQNPAHAAGILLALVLVAIPVCHILLWALAMLRSLGSCAHQNAVAPLK